MDFTKYQNKLVFVYSQESRVAYDLEEARLRDLFKADALKETGLDTHPRADLIYEFAWKMSHAEGPAEVYYSLCDLKTLILG